MTDSPKLETVEQALAWARGWFEELVEQQPEEARVILGRPTGPIGWTEAEERGRAFHRMLENAIEVRCIHRCEHMPGEGIALLRCGIYCCDECRERFADVAARDDGLCDLCDGPAPRPGSIEFPVVGFPDANGPTVMAQLCDDCGRFVGSLLTAPSRN